MQTLFATADAPGGQRRREMTDEERFSALEAANDQAINDWYDRPEWERRRVIEQTGTRELPIAYQERLARDLFVAPESLEELARTPGWYERPEWERRKIMEQF